MGDTKERLTLADAQGWGEFRVGDLFDITRGKRITKAFAEEHSGNIPVIAGGESNNGILCYLSEDCKNIRVWKNECITVASYGTAGCVHYQGQTSFIDDKALALELKNHRKNMYIYLFMSAILEGLRGKYNYGYGVTPDRYEAEKILLPTTPDGLPDYDFMENYIKQLYDDFADRVCVYTEPVEKNTDISLSDREWKEFQLKSLFTKVSRGKRLTKANRIAGNTPMVTAGFLNYGVGEYISNPEQQRFSDAITIDMFCNAFYRGSEFCCDDNIIVLQNNKITKYQKIFITAIINERKSLYSYGNQYRLGDLETHIVSLPVTPDGQPDYEFMEQYIKSLPFSKAMEL